MSLLRKTCGPLYPLLICALLMLAVFMSSRLLLLLWQGERISSLQDVQQLFCGALRIDISTICYLLLLPALLSCLLPSSALLSAVLRGLMAAFLLICVFMEAVSVPFIQEYDLRPNRLFLEYLIYPTEVMGMLAAGYKTEIVSVLAVVAAAAMLLLGRGARGGLLGLAFAGQRPAGVVRRLVLALAVAALGVLGARGTLSHRPLNVATVVFSTDALLNDLTLNSTYSVIFAALQMTHEDSAIAQYPQLDEQRVIDRVRSSLAVPQDAFRTDIAPMWARHEAVWDGSPRNIVIILLESHGAQYVRSLGGLDLSPHLDALLQEGWSLHRLYATGTRSVRGIEAVISGFPPTPARAVVKLGRSQHDFFTIARVLRESGYLTQFIYGGESHFDNMKSFFLGNGFTDIQDLTTFEAPQFVGSWGVSDSDLYARAHAEFTRLHERGQRFMSLVFTSSNHSPFECPDSGYDPRGTQPGSRERAVVYADHALGEFMEAARSSPYWQDTVFAVLADHDARTHGSFEVPVERFHIPGVFLGGGISPREDHRLVSQLDIPQTLLSLSGHSSVNPMIGHDLSRDIPQARLRALMQRDKAFAYMNAGGELVLLRPQAEVATYRVEAGGRGVTDAACSQDTAELGHALGLWGSLAYLRNWYRAGP